MRRSIAPIVLAALLAPLPGRAIPALRGFGAYEFGMSVERAKSAVAGLSGWRLLDPGTTGNPIWTADSARIASLPARVTLRFVEGGLAEVRFDVRVGSGPDGRRPLDAWRAVVAALSKDYGAPDTRTEEPGDSLATWRLDSGGTAIDVEGCEGEDACEGGPGLYATFRDLPRFEASRRRRLPR
jgi:hypothetical protein